MEFHLKKKTLFNFKDVELEMPFLVTLGEMLFNSQMRDAWDAD